MSLQRVLTTETEIKDSLLKNLGLVFGESEAVDRAAFREKHKSLVDSAIAVSAPFLAPETIRYQTMLLSLSVIFISVSLFRIGKIKIADSLISVDSKLLVLYAILILTICVIFLMKASLDYRRAGFVREQNEGPISELKSLINLGNAMDLVQAYFWLEISDAIERSREPYADALLAVREPEPNFKYIPRQVVKLDRADLSKMAEAKAEIARLDAHLESFKAELAEDQEQFRRESVEIVNDYPRAVLPDPRPQEIRESFEQYLVKWFNARNALADNAQAFVAKNTKHDPAASQEDPIVEVRKRVRSIQRLYLALEIVAPIAFAIICILYVGFR